MIALFYYFKNLPVGMKIGLLAGLFGGGVGLLVNLMNASLGIADINWNRYTLIGGGIVLVVAHGMISGMRSQKRTSPGSFKNRFQGNGNTYTRFPLDASQSGNPWPAAGGNHTIDQNEILQMVLENNRIFESLLKNGEKGDATILDSQDTGILINGENPIIKFYLEVTPARGGRFQAETMGPVLKTSLWKFEPGKVVPVLYDPVDRTKVMFDRVVESV